MKKIDNESGFSVVELLLVIIIVILLGFIGWYIYHTDHKATPSNTTTSKTASSSSKKSVSYFTITQWGVRAPYSGSLTLEYTISTSGGQSYAILSSSQLDASDPACQSAGNYGGIITRYASTDIVQDEGGSSGLTPSQYFSQYDISSAEYSHVGNYYYLYTHPQAACSSSQTSQNLQTETDSAFEIITSSIQAAPTN